MQLQFSILFFLIFLVMQLQKPQLIKNGRRIQRSTENYVPIVDPGLSTGSLNYTHVSSIVAAGLCSFYLAASNNTK